MHPIPFKTEEDYQRAIENLVAAAMARAITKYSDDQPRDEHGRWVDTGAFDRARKVSEQVEKAKKILEKMPGLHKNTVNRLRYAYVPNPKKPGEGISEDEKYNQIAHEMHNQAEAIAKNENEKPGYSPWIANLVRLPQGTRRARDLETNAFLDSEQSMVDAIKAAPDVPWEVMNPLLTKTFKDRSRRWRDPKPGQPGQ